MRFTDVPGRAERPGRYREAGVTGLDDRHLAPSPRRRHRWTRMVALVRFQLRPRP